MGFGSGIGYREKFLSYVGDGDPRRIPVPHRVWVWGKSSPEAANGDGDGDIFPKWGRVWGAIPHRKIPRCHI
jgi:hypothetical protein